MALSALKMFTPYSGNAASAPGGSGNGAPNRVAVWSDANNLTSFTGFTYDGTTFNVPANGIIRNDNANAASLQIRNDNAGAGAFSQLKLSSNAGDMVLNVNSVAAGNSVQFTADATLSGGFQLGILGNNTLSLFTNGSAGLTVSGAGLVTVGRAADTTTDHAINGNTEATAGAVAEYWQVTFNGATRRIAMLATA